MKVHQALHGYREGHRLLASSVELSAADRQRLAVQTDNADAGKSGDWKELLAGYPLPSGLYAWSMTWPAPEMPRPGCVWAHTLLFDPTAPLALDAERLLGGFRRPEPEQEGHYTRPLPSKELSPLSRATGSKEPGLLRALLWSFYEPPLMSVRVTGSPWPDRDRHRVMVAIWLQQWASLRASCSFTDAPSTLRRLDEGTPFDLQMHRTPRAQHRREGERVLSGVPKATPPSWAEAAAEQLFADAGLDEFLRAYGEELGADRESFAPLVSVWLAASGEARMLAPALAALLSLFPHPEQGAELKQALLEPKSRPRGCQDELDNEALLLALMEVSDVTALPLERLDLDRRLAAMLKADRDGAGRLLELAAAEPNQLAPQVLDHFTDSDSPHLHRWLAQDASALRKLVALRPQLLASPRLWRQLDPESLRGAISSLRGKARQQQALAAMLASDAQIDPVLVLGAWKDGGGLLLEEIVDSPPKKALAGRWLAAVSGMAIVDWLNARGEETDPLALRLLLAALESQELRAVQPSLLAVQLKSDKTQELTAKTFLAAVSQAREPSWASLAVATYERLLDSNGQRPGRAALTALADLQPNGAEDGPLKERLARALNLAFQEDYWDPLTSLELSATPFNALIGADKKAGLARRILSAGIEQPDAFKRWQRDALMRNVEARADRASLLGLLKRLIWPF